MAKAMSLVGQPPASDRSSSRENMMLDRTKSTAKLETLTLRDGKSLPEISLEEVYWHDTAEDCWIVVYDLVFDVTAFLQEHPGGEEVLLEHAGRDATIAFSGVGHSHEALNVLEKYVVGTLPEKQRLYRNGR